MGRVIAARSIVVEVMLRLGDTQHKVIQRFDAASEAQAYIARMRRAGHTVLRVAPPLPEQRVA